MRRICAHRAVTENLGVTSLLVSLAKRD